MAMRLGRAQGQMSDNPTDQGLGPVYQVCGSVGRMSSELTRSAPLGTRFWAMLTASLACAITSRFSISVSASDLGLWLGVLLSIAWAIILLMAVRQYRWRGLWLLAGAPLALWLPYTMYLMVQACSQNRLACP